MPKLNGESFNEFAAFFGGKEILKCIKLANRKCDENRWGTDDTHLTQATQEPKSIKEILWT